MNVDWKLLISADDAFILYLSFKVIFTHIYAKREILKYYYLMVIVEIKLLL